MITFGLILFFLRIFIKYKVVLILLFSISVFCSFDHLFSVIGSPQRLTIPSQLLSWFKRFISFQLLSLAKFNFKNEIFNNASLNKEENDILNKIELNQDEYTWFNKFKKKYIKSFTKKCEKEYVDTGIFKLKELKKELNSWIDSIL